MIEFDSFELNNVSDEMLAAYIDGNATNYETRLIEDLIKGDSDLMEIIDIGQDMLFSSEMIWQDHKLENMMPIDNFLLESDKFGLNNDFDFNECKEDVSSLLNSDIEESIMPTMDFVDDFSNDTLNESFDSDMDSGTIDSNDINLI